MKGFRNIAAKPPMSGKATISFCSSTLQLYRVFALVSQNGTKALLIYGGMPNRPSPRIKSSDKRRDIASSASRVWGGKRLIKIQGKLRRP